MALLGIPWQGEHDMEDAEAVGMTAPGAAKRAVSPWRAGLVVITIIPVLLACA